MTPSSSVRDCAASSSWRTPAGPAGEIPLEPLPHHLTYRELPRYFARFDRGSYSRLWRLKQLWKGLWYAVFQGRSVRVA